MSLSPIIIIWLRQDLRLNDNPALHDADRLNAKIVPLFIDSFFEEKEWAPGAASRWWLHHSLTALEESLRNKGSRLIIRRGPALDVLKMVLQEVRADAIYWNRCYEPEAIARDTEIKRAMETMGVETQTFNSALLFEPNQIQTKQGGFYSVFTPYWKRCMERVEEIAPPCAAPAKLNAPKTWPQSLNLESLELPLKVDWAAGLRETWRPGEAGAQDNLEAFLDSALANYDTNRDRPDLPGTSMLSPHLHFGEIGPRQVWAAIRERIHTGEIQRQSNDVHRFLTELGWREFAYHLLYHAPRTTNNPLRENFYNFPWEDDAEALSAWQKGQTGYPIVDAGMRELWSTGWMHNRMRMIVASFLTKNLRQHWLHGARWFWDTLVDADLANNTLGWQWTAGCGADAAPYWRIFNPMSQGKKFDPSGHYIRRHVPELAALPDRWLNQPWQAPQEILRQAGVVPGETYPYPIVDYAESRQAALSAWQFVKQKNSLDNKNP